MHTVHRNTCTQLAAQTNTDRKCSSLMVTHRANGLIPLTLAEQGSLLGKYENIISINMHNVDPSSTRLRHSAQRQSLDPSFPRGALADRSHQCCNPTLAAGRDLCSHRHSHRWIPQSAGLKNWQFSSRNALATPASCIHAQMVSQSMPRLHKLSGSWVKSPNSPIVIPQTL